MNNRSAVSGQMGPLSAPPRSSTALTDVRRTLRDAVVSAGQPVSIPEVAELTGTHPNTVRSNLDALVADGLLARQPAPVRGRGRPAWLYAAGTDTSASDDVVGLVGALSHALRMTTGTEQARELAVSAGEVWGHKILERRGEVAADALAIEGSELPPRRTRRPSARVAAVQLLDEMGFEPTVAPRTRTIRLTRCPLVDAAREHPDTVCAVHLGVLRAIVEDAGGEPDSIGFVPFAEPGACVVTLGARGTRAQAATIAATNPAAAGTAS